MKRAIKLVPALAVFAPAKMFACGACYANGANINDPMTAGMNWAIFTLGAVVATVLGAFMTYFIFIVRRGAAMEAARARAAAAAAAAQLPVIQLPPLPADVTEKLNAETHDHEHA